MKPLTSVVSDWVKQYFEDQYIEITENENRATYRFVAEGKDELDYTGYVEVYEQKTSVVVYLYAPFNVPERCRRDVAEQLIKANFNLPCGAIGMDMDEGVLRYKSATFIEEGQLSVPMIQKSVDRGVTALDKNLSAINDIIFLSESSNIAVSSQDENDPDEQYSEVLIDWCEIAGNEPIVNWTNSLKHALTNGNSENDWALSGHGVVLINDDSHYCAKVLKRVAADTQLQFVKMEAADVMDMPPPMSLKKQAPMLVYLEPGRWLRKKPDVDESEETTEKVTEFQKKLIKWLARFDPKNPVVYVTSVERMSDLPDKFINVNNFDRVIVLDEELPEVMARNFLDTVGRNICSDELLSSLSKVGKLLKCEVPKIEQRNLFALVMERFYSQSKTKITFVDLVAVIVRGMREEGTIGNNTEALRWQRAVHEAGHAVVAAFDSDGKNIPEYASIIPSISYGGVTVESYMFHHTHDDMATYRDFRHNTRICLAGRAAEEVVFGIEGISSGASSDLEQVSRQASKGFARWGFAPGMENSGKTAINLAVVVGTPSPSEYLFVETLCRQFLEAEYAVVKQILLDKLSLLNMVTERLMEDKVLDQQELREMMKYDA